MTFEMQGAASAYINADPARVYALVSDVTRMGEWSPECQGADWAEGFNGPAVGAQFHGHNKRNGNEWTTPNTVLAAEEGREFSWVVGTAEFQVCRWSFTFEPKDGGTLVTEAFELGEQPVGFASTVMEHPEHERQPLIDARREQLVTDIELTLGRLKEFLEGS